VTRAAEKYNPARTSTAFPKFLRRALGAKACSSSGVPIIKRARIRAARNVCRVSDLWQGSEILYAFSVI